MTGPGPAHERRRLLLADTATLAGLTAPLRLPLGLEPDVARADPTGRLLLVGDAKDTETPGCAATVRRLRRYGAALLDPVLTGARARLVLAVRRPHPQALPAWLDVLSDAVRLLPAGPPQHLLLDEETTLLWVDVAERGRIPTV